MAQTSPFTTTFLSFIRSIDMAESSIYKAAERRFKGCARFQSLLRRRLSSIHYDRTFVPISSLRLRSMTNRIQWTALHVGLPKGEHSRLSTRFSTAQQEGWPEISAVWRRLIAQLVTFSFRAVPRLHRNVLFPTPEQINTPFARQACVR